MNVIGWMLDSDVFLQYLVKKDLLDTKRSELSVLRKRILTEGYAKKMIEKQDLSTYRWAEGVYSPKYISTHYTLLELCQLNAPITEERFVKAVEILFDNLWVENGKVNNYRHQDICVVAMMVRIATQTSIKNPKIEAMIDYILAHQMSDGGFNCAWERKPYPKQSSLHTTISVLEAFDNYRKQGYKYRLDEIKNIIPQAVEYLLTKSLFRSVRTKNIIHKDMLSFPFPYGWKYDILRALFIMAELDIPYDYRMQEALEIIKNRLDMFGRIKADKKPPSLHHFRFTSTNKPCPFNTYRVLRVLKYYEPRVYQEYLTKEIE